jgi:hypothetical protein
MKREVSMKKILIRTSDIGTYYPGFHAGVGSRLRFTQYFSLTPELVYCRFSEKIETNSDILRASLHLWNITAFAGAFYPISEDVDIYAEFGPGFYGVLTRFSYSEKTSYDFYPCFGLSFGPGFRFKQLLVIPKMHIVFLRPEEDSDYIYRILWFNLSFGFSPKY